MIRDINPRPSSTAEPQTEGHTIAPTNEGPPDDGAPLMRGHQ